MSGQFARIALVGNPNCGKTTLFNALTGAKQHVGNWAGVTVDRAVGKYESSGRKVEVIDLPGVYGLAARSADEQVARDYLFSRQADVIVNVVDAANLERNLYLTVQLLEMGAPVVVALNMVDAAANRGKDIDIAKLSSVLGCPVIPIIAAESRGLCHIRLAVDAAKGRTDLSPFGIPYPDALGAAIDQLCHAVAPETSNLHFQDPLFVQSRWRAIKLLERESAVENDVDATVIALRDSLEASVAEELDEDIDVLIADARYGVITRICSACTRHHARLSSESTARLDRVVLDRRWGIPIFLGVMYLMFMITINVGTAFIDLFDQLAGAIFVEGVGAVLSAVGFPDWLVTIVADGAGGGIQTVASFIPPIALMFVCLRFLEESGYMARAAFVMDRAMTRLGLPGKAFVPMIVGFGCNVPAIMGARTLDNERDRRLAVSMNPFMSCGARLPVYALFAAAFFPASGQAVVFSLYLIGIGFAVMTGLILKRTLLVGELTPFVMELPEYQRPRLGSVLSGAWDRLRAFIFGAGRIIVPIVMVLTVLNSLGTDRTVGNDNTNKSVLSAIGMTITPVFAPMGIEQDNWPATVGIFTGVFAKEAVIGTLDSLYTQMGDQQAGAIGAGSSAPPPAPEGSGIWGAIGGAFATVPPNVAAAAGSIIDPLGLGIIGQGGGDLNAAADAQGIDGATLGAVQLLFNGGVGAYAYLLFVLLYIPCVAATAAIARETTKSWATFVALWTTGLAYMAATIFYQAATFSRHPQSSMMWIVFMLGIFAAVLVWMRSQAAGPSSQMSAASMAPVRALAAPPALMAPPAPAAPVRATAGPSASFELPRLSIGQPVREEQWYQSRTAQVEPPTTSGVRLPLQSGEWLSRSKRSPR